MKNKKMKTAKNELADELNRLGPRRYANLDQEEAAALAHKDFIEEPDIFLPHNKPGTICKMFATDFFRLAAKYSPALINDKIVHDMCQLYPECIPNGATQMNILIILGRLKRKDCIGLIKQVIADTSVTLDVANEAKKVIQGELEITRSRWISL